jgi:UPF0755 protein
VSQGPPPVPGGRKPEEREAARRERAARRAARADRDGTAHFSPEPTAPGPRDGEPEDWLKEADPTLRPEIGTRGARRPRAPRWGRIIVALIAVAMLATVGWFLVSLFQPFHGDGEGDSMRVVVPQGSTLGDIADLLERDGVVASAGFFELRARIEGRSGDLKPGPYRFKENMSYDAVLDRLEKGVAPNVVRVAIPEGRSRREIAPLVDGLEGHYLRATRRSQLLDPRDYRARRARSLEGFLFPATYELKKGQGISRLVERQLEAFKRNFDEVDLKYARSRNLTPYDVLIIASMVEREAQVSRERRLVASVIYNRLRQGIPLGIDATIRYALNQWNRPLRESELETSSPYNTREIGGLPPGPIGNPGLASIKAAARPARTNYLYFVVKPGTCGEHAFSATFSEFQADSARYDRARARRGGNAPTQC